MTDTRMPTLQAAVPILAVSDVAAAVEYYKRVLGFEIAWQWGEPPRLASVCRDQVELNLSQSTGAKPAISRVYFQMTGIDAYYAGLAAAGAKVAVPIGDRTYGMRDFRIVDPSGNELSFGEEIGS